MDARASPLPAGEGARDRTDEAGPSLSGSGTTRRSSVDSTYSVPSGFVDHLNSRQISADAPGDPRRGVLDRVSARCAYRAVVCTCVWPSSFPIMVRLSPRASALEAYECRSSSYSHSSSPREPRWGPYRISAAMLSAIRSAVSWIESCARWA